MSTSTSESNGAEEPQVVDLTVTEPKDTGIVEPDNFHVTGGNEVKPLNFHVTSAPIEP